MKVLLIEDEAPAARRLQKLLAETGLGIDVLAVLESISAAIEWFAHSPHPDLIFMDVQLSDGLCFEIFRQIEVESPVVFTTAYDQYALQAFKVNSVDYLLKPVIAQDLAAALTKYRKTQQLPGLQRADAEKIIRSVLNRQPSYRTRFLIEHRDTFLKVDADSIAYFYLEGGLSHLVTHDKKILVVGITMEELEKQIDPGLFFRISRQMILHVQSVSSIHKYFGGKLKLTLKPDVVSEVVVSREKSIQFREWLVGK